jgi:energy-coupling factor transporter ATP-binding protein EcfA2
MKLVEVQVTNFRNILDSTLVKIEPGITCLVGKNESGKTAFLHALYRLNPSRDGVGFSARQQYPAWLEKQHRREGKNLEEMCPIKAVFELETEDVESFVVRFGGGTLKSARVVVEREYGGSQKFDFEYDETKAVVFILGEVTVPADFKGTAANAHSFSDLDELNETLKANGGETCTAASQEIEEVRGRVLRKSVTLEDALVSALAELTPKFFYFDEYSTLRADIKIRELLQKDRKALSDEEATSRSLLELAGAENEYLLNVDYEIRKRELENVATSITQDVLKYWTTNQYLRAFFDITQINVPAPHPGGQQSVLDELKIRLWDDRHFLSLRFDERSSGFRWFFSFLAGFSKYEHSKQPIIILLDEPGLGLHARAQHDFLTFIEERLAKRCQVIYTTHSPFLVQPAHLERARLVQDEGRDVGARVTSDVLTTDKDTIFPLQSALGYDLAQHLFIAPHNLVVEGTSDYTYLVVLSDHLKSLRRTGLDERWSIIPVGGADLVPSFVALLGHHLEVTVLLDSRREGNQRLMKLADQGILERNRIITVGEILGTKLGDIEDLFAPDEYLTLYNEAFGAALRSVDLKGTDPIVSKIARSVGIERFDHGRPADVFLRKRDAVLKALSAATLDRFEELFKKLNATFK